MFYCNDYAVCEGICRPGTVVATQCGGLSFQELMMWRSNIQFGYCFLRYLAFLVGALALSGCASTISARVTSYEQWPADAAGSSYRIVASPEQRNSLEFQSFSDMVRAAIGPTGLVEAVPSDSARFDVLIEYGSPAERRYVQRYNDPYMDGWGFSPFFGGLYGGHGGWGWGSGIYMGPSAVTVPVEVYKNTLMITIKDNHNNGMEVYRSSAVNISEGDNLATVMPYLAQAVFDGFPGNNGQVREVRYDRNH